MKQFISIILTGAILSGIFSANAQCPVPSTCMTSASSGVNYTVNAGQVLCILAPTNYNAGTITLNGGTVYVASGATLSRDIAPASPSIINICGTLSGTRRFNGNATINYYGTSNVSIDYSNGGIVNNYSNTISINISNLNNTFAGLINYGTGVNLSISSWNSAFTLTNETVASMTVSNSPTIRENSTITNNGVLVWSPQLVANTGATITNNAGATISLNSGSGANLNGATFNNSGAATFAAGPLFQNSATVNNNTGGSFTVSNGRMDLTGSSTFNNSGATTIRDLIVQGNATLNNNAGGTFTQTSGTMDINGGTINNSGAITAFDLKLSSGAFNMNNLSELNIAHQITTLDLSINLSNAASGCSYINLGDAVEKTAPNRPLTTGSGSTAICGKVPYKTTDANNVTAATNGSPIRVSMASNTNNRVANGVQVYITGVAGNTGVNGLWTVANYNATTRSFDLLGSDGTSTGAYSGGGTVNYDVNIGANADYMGYDNCSNPCATALPVQLSTFDAQRMNDVVLLNWSTNSEINSKQFDVQRSQNGVNYETLTTTPAAGNSRSTILYSHIDDSPLVGINFYRLKTIDINGSSVYSEVRMVSIGLESSFTLYPNPSANGSFTIASHEQNSGEANITLLDATGRTIREFQLASFAQPISISDLDNGIYLVSISGKNIRAILKIIIQ